MVVHLAFATLLAQAERYEGTFGKMRLSPIAEALRVLIRGPERRPKNLTPSEARASNALRARRRSRRAGHLAGHRVRGPALVQA